MLEITDTEVLYAAELHVPRICVKQHTRVSTFLCLLVFCSSASRGRSHLEDHELR